MSMVEYDNGDRAIMCDICGSHFTKPFNRIVAEHRGLGRRYERYKTPKEKQDRYEEILAEFIS